MPIPIQVQHIKAFGGEHEGVDVLSLADTYSAGGSKNIWLDKFGRIRSIPGYTPAATSSGFSGVGTRAVSRLFPYVTSDARHFIAEVRRTDSGNLVGLYYNTAPDTSGATYTLGWAISTPAITKTAYFPFDACRFGDTLYLTHAWMESAPVKYAGSSISSCEITDRSPTVTIGAAGAAGSGSLNGTYYVKLVSKLNDGTTKVASVESAQFTNEHTSRAYSWTADADTDVVGYDLYRTINDSKVYFKVAYIDGRTTVAFTDTRPDEHLVAEGYALDRHGDPPPDAISFCEVFGQRMWWGREDTAAKDRTFRVYWSEVGEPASVYAENYLEFKDGGREDDPAVGITGMVGDYKDSLVVFTEGSVWRVFGSGTVVNRILDWSRERTNAHIGAVSNDSIIRVPKGARFLDQNGEVVETATEALAYFTPIGDIRLFDGDSDTVISRPVMDTLAEFNASPTSRHMITACHDRERQHIIWTFATGTDNIPSTSVCWNYRFGAWTVWPNTPLFHIIETKKGSDPAYLYACGQSSDNPTVFEFFTGNNFDGVAIESELVTKPLFGAVEEEKRVQEATPNMKRWRWGDFLFELDDTSDPPSIQWGTGVSTGSTTFHLSKTVPITNVRLYTSSGDPILTAGGEPILVPESPGLARVRFQESDGRYTHHEAVRIKVYSSSSTGGWILSGFSLAYQILPGLKRRNQ